MVDYIYWFRYGEPSLALCAEADLIKMDILFWCSLQFILHVFYWDFVSEFVRDNDLSFFGDFGYLCLVLLSGQYWLCKRSLGIFFTFQFFGIFLEVVVVFLLCKSDRILYWALLSWECFNYCLYFTDCYGSIYSIYFIFI